MPDRLTASSPSLPGARLALLMIALLASLAVASAGLVGSLRAAPAAPADSSDPTARIAVWKQQLDVLDTEIRNTQPPTEPFLSRVADDLGRISAETTGFIAENASAVGAAKALLDKLGNPPKEGEPPEAEEVAAQRSELGKRFTTIDGAIRTAASLKERAAQLREAVVASRRDLFVTEIMRKGRSPFSLDLWREAVPDVQEAWRRVGDLAASWARQHNPGQLALIVLAVMALGTVLQLAMSRLISYYRSGPDDEKLPFFRQAASAAVITMLRTLPTVIAAVALFAGLTLADMLSEPFDEIVPVALVAIATVMLIRALATTLLAPRHPQWRILPVSSPNARRLNKLLFAIAGVYGIDLFLDFLNRTLRMPLSLTILQSAVAAVIFAGLLVGVLRTPFRAHAIGGPQHGGGFIRLLKAPLWLVVYAVLAATAFGYISLARFLSQQTVVTGSIFIILYLGHLAINEFTDSFADGASTAGSLLRTSFGLSTQRREQIGAIALLTLNVLLAATALPFVLLQWGFGWGDVSAWLHKALFGFEFGGLNISLVSLLVAIAVFLGGLVLTKLFQGWLDQRILSKSHSQTGAEHSIKTAVGYIGVIASALVAVSYAGIGFANVAIVAGALSVGIGFGLQSIVNNFVSGLILLVERPIKVGDWIVVGNDEGYVRRISVRSTEIETFDRANIIVPNSELISGTVKNWTLRGPLGRISIPVGVAYDADSKQVHELLLDVARQNPSVLEYPAPYVVFKEFGESSLDFVLRVFVSDINTSLSVRTALRHEILRRFREERIEIPYRQTDLHIRDLDQLIEALRGLQPGGQPPRQGDA